MIKKSGFKLLKEKFILKLNQIFCWEKGLSTEERPFLFIQKQEKNISHMLFAIIILILIELSNLVVDFFAKPHQKFALYYTAGSFVIILYCLIFLMITPLIGIQGKIGVKMNQKRALIISFWLLTIVSALFFSGLDMIEREEINNFIFICAVIATVPVMNVSEAAVSFSLIFGGQCLILFLAQENLFRYQHCFMFAAGCFLLSQIIYVSYYQSVLLQKKLNEYARHDSLTGLLNRRGIDHWISEHISQDSSISASCGFIDIDNFKLYNDCFGHICGDECLKNLCKEINYFFADQNSAVCRFGGEEIVVILFDRSREEATHLLLKLKNQIENLKIPISDKTDEKYLTVSIGFSYQENYSAELFDLLVRQADKALYIAKRSGRNLVADTAGNCRL